MVENGIRSMLWKKNVKQADIVRRLDGDVNPVQFSAITAGNVLPTRGTLDVICQMLDCSPTDIYDRRDLILLDEPAIQPIQEADVHGSHPLSSEQKEDHDGMERFRVWMRPEEKEALIRACAILGYRNVSEWFREAYREALARCAAIANALPQQTEIAAAAGGEHYTVADIPHRLLSSSLVKL